MKIVKYMQSLTFKNNGFRIYLFSILLRIALVFVPQTGYIHPDEFFQSVEIFVGDQFEVEHERTWEFNNSFPIRNILIPYVTIKLPLAFLQFISTYVNYYLGLDLLNGYAFLVFPRIVMCILSFLNDISLYSICKVYSVKYETRLLAMGTSFVMVVFATRTFSNTIEMTLCSVLLYFVSDCMIHSNTILYKMEALQLEYRKATTPSERVKVYKIISALPAHSLNRVVLMATLCAIGVFNRPTFLVFGAPMVFFWLLRGMGTKVVTFVDFNVRILLFTLCTIPTIAVFTIADSLYYGYLTTGEIHMLDISINNFVFTPWNFIKYNLDPSNTARHGVHPRYLHMLVNVPLLYNILGVVAVFSFAKLVRRFLSGDYRNLPRSQSIIGLMTSAVFAPLMIMSYFNHQEARFLLPLALPIFFLHGHKLDGISFPNPYSTRSPLRKELYDRFIPPKMPKRVIMQIWCTVNIILLIFYGFLHQGGVYQLSSHFSHILKTNPMDTNVHLITSHLYSFPLAFVNTPSTTKIHVDRTTRKKYRRERQFFVDELGSADITRILSAISNIVDRYEASNAANSSQRYEVYVGMPASLCDEFDEMYRRNMTDMKFSHIHSFYPHLSTEAMPSVLNIHMENDMWSVSGVFMLAMNFFRQFSLALYRYEV